MGSRINTIIDLAHTREGEVDETPQNHQITNIGAALKVNTRQSTE